MDGRMSFLRVAELFFALPLTDQARMTGKILKRYSKTVLKGLKWYKKISIVKQLSAD